MRETAGSCWQRRIHAHRMRAGSHERLLGVQKASGLARAAPWRVRAPRMRAGSRERHLRVQNASGLARTQPGRVQTLRMRAGSHGRHLPECERTRTNTTSDGSRAQNASGHAQTPPRSRDEDAQEGCTKEGERPGERQGEAGTEAPRSFIKKEKVTKHLCFIGKDLRQQKSAYA